MLGNDKYVVYCWLFVLMVVAAVDVGVLRAVDVVVLVVAGVVILSAVVVVESVVVEDRS